MNLPKIKSIFSNKSRVDQPGAFKRNESGQSLVELAISMVVLLILIAGITDLSRTILTKMALQDAVEDGIIYGIVKPKNCTQIKYRVIQNLSKVNNIALSDIVVTYDGVACPSSGDLKGDLMRITVSNSFPVSMPFLGTFISNPRTIQAEAKGIVIKSN